jgi:circadian clock protein KaiC
MNRDIEESDPQIVVVDAISAFRGPSMEIYATLVRIADICKTRAITAVFTNLAGDDDQMSDAERGISSLMDTWISLRDLESNGERNRVMYLLKSRGMSHSNQMREFRLTDHGIELIDAYIGPSGVLTGAARAAQEANERETELARKQSTSRRRREFERRRIEMERQIVEVRAALEAEEGEIATIIAEEEAHETAIRSDREGMATRRGVRK